MPYKQYSYYLAGPFFNVAQVALIDSIEILFTVNTASFFSPRSAPANAKGKELTNEDADEIFRSNVRHITARNRMLAVLDWMLPPGFSVHLVQSAGLPMVMAPYDDVYCKLTKGDIMSATVVAPYLNLPDTGTVWEMGYAFAHQIPIYGFTMRPRTDKLNLMLTQCCAGVISGLNDLDAFLKGDETVAKPWEVHL